VAQFSTLGGFGRMTITSQTIPVHIAIIFDDYVRLHGDVGHLWQQLQEAGYADRLFVDEQGYSAIRFIPGTPHAKNIPLLTLLFLLNDLGIPFAEDHTQLWSPAGFMRELQSELVLRKPFRSIAAKSASRPDWSCIVHEPAT
jgi:hypothetical protein